MGKGLAELTLTASPVGRAAIMFYLPQPLQADYPVILNDLSQYFRAFGVLDCVAAYHSLLVVFDPDKQTHSALVALANRRLPQAISQAQQRPEQQLIRIPVCYDQAVAPDLAKLAEKAGLTPAQVIKRHTERIYTVCCLGFIPGFAFLGYVDKRIATPRLANPRAKVPAGSVGIAGQQTGIYPADSPGGWNLIGRTPKVLYAPEKEHYSCFEMGDKVQFYAIDSNEWESFQGAEE